MNTQVPEHLRQAASETKEQASETSLNALRDGVARFRDLQATKADLEERLKAVNIEINDMEFGKLVDLMDAARVPSITIEAEGNLPKMQLDIKPYYHANISADWPEDKRRAGFRFLDEDGSGDLIKTEVTTAFARGERDEALKYLEKLRAEGKNATAKENVAWNTLTAWVKEQIEKKNRTFTPEELEALGAKVGRVAKIKPLD